MNKKGKKIIPRTLVTQRLESVSKAVFKKYFPLRARPKLISYFKAIAYHNDCCAL